MEFPLSGVEVSPIVPVLVGFCVATLTTPVGVSGAFLLLPFQVSVLGFTTPGVTPTNLLFNVISTPGGITGYRRAGAVDRTLARAIAAGAVPGVIIGSVLRVSLLAGADTFKLFAGAVLLVLGLHLVLASARRKDTMPAAGEGSLRWVTAIAAVAGTIGGIYGISGGSIIAPFLVGVLHLPVRRVASAALVATFITSCAGVLSFLVLDLAAAGASARPDWMLAALFGVGGMFGGRVGARLAPHLPERALRALLGALAVGVGVSYLAPAL